MSKRLSKRDEKEAIDGLIKEYFTKSEGLHLEEVGSFLKRLPQRKKLPFHQTLVGRL